MRGVYFLANDTVLENTIAFLNSFRLYNPDLPLCLIPFDDSFETITALQDEYGFTIYQNEQVLRECDDISKQFHGRTLGLYRKLAAWEGPFEEFIYIDTDTVVLEDVRFVFPLLDAYAFIVAHSNVPITRQWVWLDSIDAVDTLTEEQKSFGANSGFMCSNKRSLDLSKAKEKIPGALELREHMKLLCAEQSFFNYLFVTSGLPYTSLLVQQRAGRSVFVEHWAGMPLIAISGRVASPPHTFLVHWAGEWMRAREHHTTVRNAALWLHYRYLRIPPPYKLWKNN
jgi:hypothetical protein